MTEPENNPQTSGSSSNTVIIAIVAIVALIAILFATGVLGGGADDVGDTSIDVDVEAPEIPDVEVDTSDLEVGE